MAHGVLTLMKTLLLFRPLSLTRFTVASAAVIALGGFGFVSTAHAQAEATPAAPPTEVADPDAVSADSSLFKAISLHENKDYGAAWTEMQKAIVEYPENALANAWYGYMLLVLQKEPEKSIPYLEKAIALNPSLPSPHTNLGSALLKKITGTSHTTEETERMVQEFQTAVKLTPTGQTYFDLGYAQSQAGRYGDAVESYQKSLELRPNDGKTQSNLGLALQRMKKDDEAIAALKTGVANNPDDAAALSLLGMMQAQIVSRTGVQPTAKDAPGAIDSLEKSLKLEPNNYGAQTTLALMYALVGRNADAAEAYSTAAAMAEAGSKQETGSLYYNKGLVLARQEKYGEASLAYEQALSANPNYYDALVSDGYALTKQNKTDAAIARYRAAAGQAKSPKQQLLVWNNLAVAYAKKGDAKNGDYARRRVVALDPSKATIKPGTAEFWNQKGLEYQKQGKLDAALNAYQNALKRQPGSAVAHNNLGVVYEKKLRLDLAVKEYKAALATDPKMSVARANLARFSPSGLLTPKTNPLPKFAQPNYRAM